MTTHFIRVMTTLGYVALTGCAVVPYYLVSRPEGFVHTPLDELEIMRCHEMGFEVALPKKHDPPRWEDPMTHERTSSQFAGNTGYKVIRFGCHYIFPHQLAEPAKMLKGRFILISSNDRCKFLSGKGYANNERITNNTNGFYFGTNVYEEVINDRFYQGSANYTWFRRDIELQNGDVIVGTVSLVWCADNETNRENDSIAIRNILASMRPLETGGTQSKPHNAL